jgi:hypothetical protein
MNRQPKVERQERLAQKQLEPLALRQLREDFECSPFESRAMLAAMQATFEWSWEGREHLKPGQLCVLAIEADEPAGKPLSECRFKPILLSLHHTDDEVLRHRLSGRRVIPELRRSKVQRMAAEALAQGTYLTVEDLANTIFNCGERTLEQDLCRLRAKGIQVPLRGQQADIGRSVSHKVQTIQLALQRKRPTEIAHRLHHSLEAIERYLADFAAIAPLLSEGWPVETISFVRRVSLGLVREYAVLYRDVETSAQRQALAALIRQWAPTRKKKSRPTQRESPK